MQTARIVTIISLLLSIAVLINSVHSKEVVASSQGGASRIEGHDDNSNLKIHTELHDHIDKAGKVLSDSPQTDTRSLRLQNHRRSARAGYLQGLFNSWRDQLALHLG